MIHTKSNEIFNEAKQYIPGGVNSPVRAFKSVGMDPIFISEAKGSKITDVDGNEYIDYICSWGPLIFGHSNEEQLNLLKETILKGTSYGVPTEIEVEMAKLIVSAYPSIDKVRMVNSGTEATMSALRVARAYTKRDKILKFEGCYHGHSDSLLVKSGSGTMTYGVPTSLGVTESTGKDTLIGKFNDLEGLKSIFEQFGYEIAAVIVEPLAANMGLIPGETKFLNGLREITSEYNSILIFDEVISGFRVSAGGIQEIYGVEPDLTCFGKIIGGGLPVGAYGGKKELMDMVSPVGSVYQAGTLSGNPLAMTLGLNTIKKLIGNQHIYDELTKKAKDLEEGFRKNIKQLDLDLLVHRFESLVCIFFTDHKVKDYDDALRCDTNKFSMYFKEMLNQGILLPPSQFESLFLSTAHSDDDINYTISANLNALRKIFDK